MAIEPIKLSPEDRQTLESLGPDIEAIEKEIVKAERAGLDVTKLKADLDKAKSLREGVLREYGG
jgi:hypothetical protein